MTVKKKTTKKKTTGKKALSSTEMRLELKRQAVHLCFGSVLAVVVFWLGKSALPLLALAITFGFVTFRLINHGFKLFLFQWFIDKFERAKVHPGKGALMFLIGAFIALALFEPRVVFVALLVLAFGDSFSTVVGKGFGRTRLFSDKTFEGFLGGFIAAFFACWFYLPLNIALAASFTGAFVELFTFTDDNIEIPLAVSLVIYIMKA